MGIIGDADEPTSIYATGDLGVNWFNVFGLILVVCLMLPNILYAIKLHRQKHKSDSSNPKKTGNTNPHTKGDTHKSSANGHVNMATSNRISRLMNIFEQIGRYSSMLFMVFNIGNLQIGSSGPDSLFFYFFENILLMIIYWVLWGCYFYWQHFRLEMMLAILPVCIFVFSGIALDHILLLISGVIFGIGHIYVTYHTKKSTK
jgi:hypothetical protein